MVMQGRFVIINMHLQHSLVCSFGDYQLVGEGVCCRASRKMAIPSPILGQLFCKQIVEMANENPNLNSSLQT